MKKILMTGGGTAGHVTPNIALIEKLRDKDFIIDYIGSKEGIEKELITNIDIPYHKISSGKLRRYLDIKNFTDIFEIIKGFGEASKIIKKTKPDVIFSKGGFVTVPVVIAGKFNKVPVVIHESDISCGLANKISIPFAKYVCCTFPETIDSMPKNKSFLTGTPIREELFKGDKSRGLEVAGFKNNKPVVLIMGGSLGSVTINNVVRLSLSEIIKKYNVIHLCGKNNLDKTINFEGYSQFEYVTNELSNLMAAADLIVSRAGANSISEFLALKKPNILIPLSLKASRGDQILNAKSFEKQGFSKVIMEDDLTKEKLIEEINNLYDNKEKYIGNMKKSNLSNGIAEVLNIINKAL